ncbi:hypothetical protein V8F06_005079 [Rhypophila decipiens]
MPIIVQSAEYQDCLFSPYSIDQHQHLLLITRSLTMPGLYKVIIKWHAPSNQASEQHGEDPCDYVVLFSSRYSAECLYRLLQLSKDDKTSKLRFPNLSRSSPQLWCHSAKDVSFIHSVFKFHRRPGTVGYEPYNKHVIEATQVIPSQHIPFYAPCHLTTGPDWVDGGTYFIRNRRQPKIYWAVLPRGSMYRNRLICATSNNKTKFRIALDREELSQAMMESQGPLILTNTGIVTVNVVWESAPDSVALPGDESYVGLLDTHPDFRSIPKLGLVDRKCTWVFGDLLCNMVGEVYLPSVGACGLGKMTQGGHDEWELCRGQAFSGDRGRPNKWLESVVTTMSTSSMQWTAWHPFESNQCISCTKVILV